MTKANNCVRHLYKHFIMSSPENFMDRLKLSMRSKTGISPSIKG